MGIEMLPSGTPAQRLACLRDRLGALGVDACWVVDPANVRYLTGFTGEDSTLLVSEERAVLVTDSRFQEQAQGEAGVDEIVCRTDGMVPTAGALCERMGLGRIGLASSHVTHADWMALAREAPAAELVALERGPADSMRMRKSREEVEAIVGALRVAEGAFERLTAQVRPGLTERWMAGLLEWEMKQGGADEPAFKTICAVGERASLPHASCTDRSAGPDSAILFDWGGRVGGYNSDLTRMAATGTMPEPILELAQVVLEAQEAAFERLGPGVRCCDVDEAARNVIVRAGYGPNFGHGLGHGVGLEVHEAPRLAARDEEILLPGMVVTVEPGIYLPGVGGVRIEDMAVITPGGCEVLSSLERRPGGRC